MNTGYPSIDKPWLKYYDAEALAAPFPKCTLYEYVWEGNRSHLENIALDYFGRAITYKEMFAQIDATARAFAALGVGKGDIVVVVAVTLPETVYAFYALNRLGAISNMVDPRTSVEGMRDYIAEVDASCVVSLDMALPKVEKAVSGLGVTDVVVLSPADSLPSVKRFAYRLKQRTSSAAPALFEGCMKWADFIKQGASTVSEYAPYESGRCAVIVHTGGTTGAPKGVMLSDDGLNAGAFECQVSGIDMKREHSWLNIMPPFVAYGVGNGLHLPLAIGMRVILVPSFDPAKFDELLLKHKPNHMVGVPSHYGNIIDSRKLASADLSYIIAPTVGGDTMELDLERRTNDFLRSHGCSYDVVKGYGMTEVNAAVSICVSNECNKLGSVGIPNVGVVISIFDLDTGEELPYGQSGEICITGPNMMIGYFGNETATRDVLRTHDDGLLWVHSGDIGHMDEDGFLFIEGRIKRMIVRHDGFKVFPAQIEAVVSSHPAVSATCVVAVPDVAHSQGKLPLAFVVAEGDADRTRLANELQSLCARELAEYAQPAGFRFIDALPLTPIGKVDYQCLERQALELGRDCATIREGE